MPSETVSFSKPTILTQLYIEVLTPSETKGMMNLPCYECGQNALVLQHMPQPATEVQSS